MSTATTNAIIARLHQDKYNPAIKENKAVRMIAVKNFILLKY
jgi:hypothetical protein